MFLADLEPSFSRDMSAQQWGRMLSTKRMYDVSTIGSENESENNNQNRTNELRAAVALGPLLAHGHGDHAAAGTHSSGRLNPDLAPAAQPAAQPAASCRGSTTK